MKGRVELVDSGPKIEGYSRGAQHRYAEANRGASEGFLLLGAS